MGSRLKSLELSGYKTFASRTLFEFADTVTTIVGPNGSGKSNIGDSLRWVLGEQSYRLLRGKKTEDMIFSGSESRSQAGMAYATITFDNTEGWLPIDFNEVAITRRAYRDGQNEYLINNQRVRLMDVSELLAQSGLAERTYTIIGQGLVDAALSLRADERRQLFEEAAGIGLHRSRREDAIRRLNTTQRNLERVQDILVELRPRLRSLERQVTRAEEYEETATELTEVLREWYGFHWHKSQEELSRAHNYSEEYKEKLSKLQVQEIDSDNRIDEFQTKITNCRNQLSKWNKEKDTLRSRREVVTREIAVDNERKRSLHEQKRVMSSELERIEQRLSIQRELLISTQDEFDIVKRNNESITKEYEDVKGTFEQKQSERDKFTLEIEGLKEAQIKLSADREKYLTQIDSRRKNIQSFDNDKNEVKKTLNDIEDNYLKTAEEAGKIQAYLKNDADKSSELQSNMDKSEKISRRIEEKINKLKQDSASLQIKHEQNLAKIQLYEQSRSNLEGYPEGAQVLVTASKDKKLSGISGVFRQILDVEAEYKLAIEAALSMYIEAVLIKNEPDIALDILQENSARGVILPLDSIDSNKARIPKNKDFGSGVIGVASEIVKFPENMKNVVEFFLGNVLVVKDRKNAKRIIRNQNQPIVAVTLDGEAFSSSGPIISLGAKGGSMDNTRLDKSEKIEKARIELNDIEKKTAEIRSELNDLEGELTSHNKRYMKLSSEKKELEEKIRTNKAEENKLSLLLERLDWQKNWYKNEIMRIEKDIEEYSQDVQVTITKLNEIEESILETDRTYSGQLKKLNNLDQELDRDQYTTVKTEFALSTRSLADSEKLLNDKKQLIEEIEDLCQDLVARRVQIEAELEKLGEEILKATESESDIQKKIGDLDFFIHEEEHKLTAILKERQSISENADNIRNQIRETEQHYTNAKIDVARQREAIENLRRRIEDDLGLVAFDYADEVSGPYPLPIDGFVEQLPVVKKLPSEYEKSLQKLRSRIRRIGPINPEVRSEYQEVKNRHEYLLNQIDDLKKADTDVRQVIKELDQLMEEEFCSTFENVAEEFEDIFSRLFGGGSAHLILSDPDDITNTGIEIDARLPGRRAQGLTLLSGGERSLTAVALIFALIRVSPTPFCLLDEVDAMLDEANTSRFRVLLKEMSQKTQFVVVTHNRNTVEAADIIYGVTMGRDSTSQVLSLKIDELSKVID
jgi:chromosome segregation protein